MFVLYAFLVAILLSAVGIFFLKTFQLENYDIKKYIKKCLNFEFATNDKNSLKITKRIKRLIFLDFFVNFLIFLPIFFCIRNWYVLIFVLIFLIFIPFKMSVSFLCAQPIENLIRKNYIKKAKKKLKNSTCKKIAITGSFGKTSTKNMLFQILSEEFSVCSTPKSFNTPMGVCKTILQDLKETDDFFVVEFGARHRGDIKFLADFVGVDFGIITPIGNCHLETFKTLQNIENTKFELCESVKDYVVFNGATEASKRLYDRFERKKYLVCQKGSFAYAENIVTHKNGSKFDMRLDGKSFACETKLLGTANIDNIVVASAMAYLLGESIFSIVSAIKKIKPVEHRLELIKGENCTIIDDSYNSNFDGFCNALEVLKNFDGRKIVVSPGIVELGTAQFETNVKAAQKVCEVADVFIIMNKTNQKAMEEGSKNFGGKCFFASTRQEQKQILRDILKSNDVILFENDLPDNFK